MVFGNKPRKKAKSLKISDRRKLCVLNVDFKVMTGIEEAQIKKTMDRKSSHLQLVLGGSNRISHSMGRVCDTRYQCSGRILQHGVPLVLQGAHQEGSRPSGNRPVPNPVHQPPVDSRGE